MASTSGPPTRSVMKRTAGAIKAGARKRRSSNRSRKRNPVGPLRATASILLAGLVPPTPKNGTRLGSRVRGILRLGVAEIALDKLTKVYPDGTRAVEELDLEIDDGEFVVLVGPSGCGKTTALRMVAGLEDITDGEVRIAGKVVNDLPPKDRDVAMVFQSYALYPHMSVYDNMAFGLKLRNVGKGVIAKRVREAAHVLGIEDVLKKKPRTLSGGQRQRVAMGRSIVREPQAFLMDEPLSNLDAKLRVQMRAEIARIQRDLGVTTIYVTHDQTEAMTLGDRVAVIKKGELQQVAPPQELYDRPANLFVAGFIGSPAMNLLQGTLTGTAGEPRLEVGGQTLTVSGEVIQLRPALSGYLG